MSLGEVLTKEKQKEINGGSTSSTPCPCTYRYDSSGDGSCTYPALYPEGFRCSGEVKNGQCCVS